MTAAETVTTEDGLHQYQRITTLKNLPGSSVLWDMPHRSLVKITNLDQSVLNGQFNILPGQR